MTVVDPDGSVNRSGELVIAPADTAMGTQDSTEALTYYEDNFEPLDGNRYQIRMEFTNGVLRVSWSGKFGINEMPIGDYAHRSNQGPVANNNITVEIKNRWFFRDYRYREIFADPVEASKYFPLIDEKLAEASQNVLDSEPLKGLSDPEGAAAILTDLCAKTGSNLLDAFMTDPKLLDSLADKYDSNFKIAGDRLAGLAGVKLNPDSAALLLKSAFDATWDTILTNHPGIFGSYGFGGDEHDFRIETKLPGCIKTGNADSLNGNVAVWNFKNTDFFAREKTLEAVSRDWSWGNVIITVIVVLVALTLILWPIRRKSTA